MVRCQNRHKNRAPRVSNDVTHDNETCSYSSDTWKVSWVVSSLRAQSAMGPAHGIQTLYPQASSPSLNLLLQVVFKTWLAWALSESLPPTRRTLTRPLKLRLPRHFLATGVADPESGHSVKGFLFETGKLGALHEQPWRPTIKPATPLARDTYVKRLCWLMQPR